MVRSYWMAHSTPLALSDKMARSHIIGTLTLCGSLTIYGTLTYFGSLRHIGTLTIDGSLTPPGTLVYNGSLSCFGTLAWRGSLADLGTLTRTGLVVLHRPVWRLQEVNVPYMLYHIGLGWQCAIFCFIPHPVQV